MSEDNILELGNHKPSVESTISRLSRFQDRIKNITVVIEWDDGSSAIYGNEKPIRDWAYDAGLLRASTDKDMLKGS